MVGIVAAFAIAVPVAFATFTDVAPDNPFYNDINAIQGAGITSGCGGGNFCPGDSIQRQAVAAWLHRAEARVAQSTTASASTILNATTLVGQVKVDVGGVAGGTQFVKVDATMTNAWQAGDGRIPITYYVSDGGACTGGNQSPNEVDTALNSGGSFANASVAWAESVPAASTQTFSLCASTNKPNNKAKVSGVVLLATTYPFGATGADTLTHP